jgi:hypothetical protein
MTILARTFLAIGLLLVPSLIGTAWALTCSACGIRGAPGPIAGAGLPVLAVGFGVYWLIRRRKAKQGLFGESA